MELKWGVTAFMIIMLLCVLMVQVITATVLLEAIQKLRGEQGIIWKNMKKLMIKQLDTIQTTGNIQNEQLKVVLKQLVARIEQEKKVTECYEKIEEITRLVLDHANAVEKENEKMRKEMKVIAQPELLLQEDSEKRRMPAAQS